MQGRTGEYDMAHQQKTDRKTHTKRSNKCRDIRLKSDKAQVHDFFVINKIIADKEYEYVKQGICASTCCITEGLPGHQLFKRRIKKVYEIGYKVFRHPDSNVRAAKVV
jgi:hypothetical protein